MVLYGFAALRDASLLHADTFYHRWALAVLKRFTRRNGDAQEAEEQA